MNAESTRPSRLPATAHLHVSIAHVGSRARATMKVRRLPGRRAPETEPSEGLPMRTVRVGLIGLGTVGSGVVEILRRHRDDFRSRSGVDIELARFADKNEARFADLE